MLDAHKNMGRSQVIDYLTCGSCLREFPLQKITAFIQHKKLDCDDENDGSMDDPELQCNYCPRGFMTAWGLLVHAQLTHNLKIFLEKASKSLLEQSKLSQISPGTQFYGSQLQTSPSVSLQSDITIPISDSLRPSVSDLVSACVTNAMFGTSLTSQGNSFDIGKNICITTDNFTGNRNVLGRETGLLGLDMSPTDNRVSDGTTLTGVSNSDLSENDQLVQVHQTIIAVPCQQIKTPIVAQKSMQNLTDPNVGISGPFRIRSNTFPNIPRLISDADFSQTVISSQRIVNSDTSKFPGKHVEGQKLIIGPPQQSRNNSVATEELVESMTEVDRVCLEELGTEKDQDVVDMNLNKQGKSFNSAKISDSKQNTNISDICICALDKELPKNNIVNSEPEKEAIAEGNTEEQENQQDDLDDEADKIEPCCDNQGCGITVIPGSHQTLQKCCNAVVPKKRKRHFETKHMPFSWSSSRYAKRRMLQSSRDRLFTSVGTTKSGFNVKGGSTIYIDVEPGSFEPGLGKSSSSVESTLQVTQSQFSTPKISSSERILTSQSRPRSLILRPGAVFSIPLTYTIPASNSASVLMSAGVPQKPLASSSLVSSGSRDTQTGTEPLSVETKEAVEQSSFQGNNSDSMASSHFEVKPVIDEEPRRRKYPTSKPFKCEECEVAFNQRIHLKKHMSKHTGVKPFKCGQCDYSTVERSHLKVHIRIHTGEKPFKCTYCEYATAQNSTLKIHLKRHHGGRMFHCLNCSKEFTQQTQLTDHEWEHSPPDNSTKQQTRFGAHKTVMKTEVLEDHPSQHETTMASTSLLTPPLQQEELTSSSAVLGHVTSATSSSTDLGHVIPAANSSTDVGHVTSATSSSTDLGHVISVPSASMTDNEAAVLLNSLTAKLLEESEQASRSHSETV